MPTSPEREAPISQVLSAARPAGILEVRDLVAGYAGAPVVHGLSLTVGRGEVVTVLGPNGSGKSTLIKAVVGQIPTMDGQVTLDGADVTNMSPDRLAAMGVGYVPQERDVFAPLSVQENLQMGAYLLPRRQISTRLEEIYQLFPVLAKMRKNTAGRLSGGERKLLAMGRVLMTKPVVLALDEPTANLSPQATREVLVDQVRRVADAGTAVLLVEQKALQALDVADWGYIFVAGQVQVAAPAEELANRPDIGEMFLGKAVNQ